MGIDGTPQRPDQPAPPPPVDRKPPNQPSGLDQYLANAKPGAIVEETQVKKVNERTGKLETIADQKWTTIPEVTVVGQAPKQDNPSPAATPKGGEEGVASFVEKALLGDFSDNTTWSGLAGQVVGGFIPGFAEVADARDIAYAVGEVMEGKEGGARDLAINTLAIIPGLDALKGIGKAGKTGEKLLKNADELAKVGKHVDEAVDVAKGSRVVSENPVHLSGPMTPERGAAPNVRLHSAESRRAADGTHQHRVIVEVQPSADQRWNLERSVVPESGTSRLHLAGRNIGAEVRTGIMNGPQEFNTSIQTRLENRLGEACEAAAGKGNRIVLEGTATSKPVHEHAGREVLDTVRYRAVEVTPDNRVVAQHLDVTLQARADGKLEVLEVGARYTHVPEDLTGRAGP